MTEERTFTGEELRKLREDLGWSRKLLSEQTGLTQSAINALERHRPPTATEHRIIITALLDTLDDTASVTPEVIADGVTRAQSWNGMNRGDPVRVQGQSGTFRFVYHHVDPTQEYIEVYGPTFSKQKNPRAPARRSFDKSRVRRVK
jgi:DNA-binding XRE family transcriptional regulator